MTSSPCDSTFVTSHLTSQCMSFCPYHVVRNYLQWLLLHWPIVRTKSPNTTLWSLDYLWYFPTSLSTGWDVCFKWCIQNSVGSSWPRFMLSLVRPLVRIDFIVLIIIASQWHPSRSITAVVRWTSSLRTSASSPSVFQSGQPDCLQKWPGPAAFCLFVVQAAQAAGGRSETLL